MLSKLLEGAEVRLATRTSRRSFIGRMGKGLVALAGGPFVAMALKPDRAEAYHICGHTYTTGSCPHPYHPLSRVDSYDKPVHPGQGYPVDDNGNIYTSRSQPRHRICGWRVPKYYPYTAPTSVDGSWSRCCYGRIRRIVDCCSYSKTRINGDASLTGYCYSGRKVFCITYYVTNISC